MTKKPAVKRLTRKAISVTIDPIVLAQIDKRGGNRSEQINQALAEFYLRTDSERTLSLDVRARLEYVARKTIPPFT